MFQLLTQSEYQQKLRQKFRYRLIILLASSFFVGIGAILAFNVGDYTGENIRFVETLLREKGIKIR